VNAARPKLARRARLRRDALSGRDVLLYPERGLVLSPSASEILALCDGTRTLDAIVSSLEERHAGVAREVLARDVEELLGALASRRLVEDAT
jgi:coenzyme PQQ biosynthesis protein PqqD